jgi:hypothetical protein
MDSRHDAALSHQKRSTDFDIAIAGGAVGSSF